MEFDRGEWQFRDDVGGVEHHVAGLAGEAEYEMSSAGEAVIMHEFYGFFCGGEGVAAVDSCQRGVINRLDAEFDDDRADRIGEGLQHCEDFLIDAVGAGADDEADDAGD